MELLIGIDGGGTKTDALLCSTDGTVQNRVKASSSNANDIGFSTAVETLQGALDSLLQHHGGRSTEIRGFFAGLSGGSIGNYPERFHAAFTEMLPNCPNVKNSSDLLCALSSGLLDQDGCVLISGTGSSGLYRHRGTIRRIGGWGYLLDKGGGGYDIGRDALYYSLMESDGRGQKTAITPLLEEKFEMSVPAHIDEVYSRGKTYIASLAPIVFEAYRKGDAVAAQILNENMRELALILNTAAKCVGEVPCKVVLVGSIFRDIEILRPMLDSYLEQPFEFILPENPPVFGAVVEAAIAAGIPLNDSFVQNFRNSFIHFS